MVPSITNLTSQKVDCWTNGGNFCDIIIGNIHPLVVHTNKCHILHCIFGGRIIVLLLVMAEVILVLEQLTSTPKSIILAETGMMGLFKNTGVSTQHPHGFI